jgi:hypothetical protein
MLRVPGPEFFRVTLFDCLLTVPTLVVGKLRLVGLYETIVPVPTSDTCCGLPAALSAIDRLAVLVPAACGLNLTATEQLEPAARLVPQLFEVTTKSAALLPLIETVLMVRVPVPEFLRLTLWVLELVKSSVVGNVKDIGDRETAGAVPVPLRLVVCGLSLALSLTDKLAVRAPVALGVKVSVIVQAPLAVKVAGQLLVCAKSAALTPVMKIELMARAPLPLFVSVTVWATLVVLIP